MKSVPMILLLIVPYVSVFISYQLGVDLMIGIFVYGALLLFNMVYAFVLPKLGFRGKQLLFWNMLLKLGHVPLIIMIFLVVLIVTVIGGEGVRDEAVSMVLIAWLSCTLIQLSSTMFGISGFRWCRKYGTLSQAGMIASSIAQFVPVVDVIGSILCYIMFRAEGQSAVSE